MSAEEVRVPVGEKSVTAIVAEPEQGGDITLIYAPGAGSSVHDPFGRHLCDEMSTRGLCAIRFQFLYQEAGRKSPDRPQLLADTWRSVIGHFGGKRLIVGGRSMGGRIASQVVADGIEADGLALFAYPLHPPGNPERSRDEHLPSITIPTLFCSGAKDAFGSPDEIAAAAALAPNASTHVVEHADHGFNVRKASGRTREDVFAEAVEAFWTWLEATG